jgi:hypothetical protein
VVEVVQQVVCVGEAERGRVTECRCSSSSRRVAAIAWPIEVGLTSSISDKTFWEHTCRR